MNSVEWYKVLLKKKAKADLKKVKLLSTSGLDETIAIVLPAKDKPTKDKNKGRKQYFRQYRQRPEIKKHHKKYVRDWNRRNPDKVKAITKRHSDKIKNQKPLKETARNNN
jgi:hypothetical protein